MVIDVLIEDVSDVLLMELLYLDDLVLCGESLNEEKYVRLKNPAEGKRLSQLCFGNKVLFRR